MTQPTSIGKYRVIAKLGQGGMARVLLTAAAGPAGFNKLMVVKELRDELAGDPEFLTMFLDEARLAARLNHPNVVNTFEVVTEGDRYYIAMDYLDGQPLNRVLHRIGYGSMPLDVHLRILCDTLEGLHYAHCLTDFDGTPLNVVHRDVSPHNIFVTYDGQVKLVDFGVAKAAGASAQTRTGVFKGKIRYMAPEQAEAQKVDRRADVYSMGVMLWETLAKRSISKGQRDLMTLHMRIEDEEPRIRDVAPDAPPALLAICEKAKAYDPAERYESAEALRLELDAWLRQGGHVGSKNIATLVSNAFAEDRAEIKAVIEEQMRGATSMIPPALPSIAELAPSTPLLSLDGSDSNSVAAGHSSSVVERDVDDSVTAKRFATEKTIVEEGGKQRWWLLAVAVAVAVVGGIATLSLREPASEPAVQASGAAIANLVLLVEATPKSATISIDGVPVGSSPYRTEVPADGSRHHIEVTAAGHVSDARWIHYERDVSLSIALAAAASSAAPTSSTDKPPAQPAAAVPASPKAEPRAVAPEPSSNKPRGPRTIDEHNPYK